MFSKQNIILFTIALIVSFVVFLPARLLVADIKVSDNLEVQINSGTIWSGKADVFVTTPPAATQSVFLAEWNLCLNNQFPFVAVCLDLNGGGQNHQLKLTGASASQISLADVSSSIPVSSILGMLGADNDVRLQLLRLRGALSLEVESVAFDLVNRLPLSWTGRVELADGGFFNLDLPPLTFLLSHEEFISSADATGSFGDSKLPTIRVQGQDERMEVVGSVQILPDKQVKLSSELTANDDLVARTFTPIATNRQGNKFFITYQGALPF